MSLVTTRATLRPDQFQDFLDKVDRLGIPYYLIRSGSTLTFACESDGADYSGLTLQLMRDGTWAAYVDVVVGSEGG